MYDVAITTNEGKHTYQNIEAVNEQNLTESRGLGMKDKVVVIIFDMIHADELSDLITEQLNDGYYIQDSHIESYQDTVNGVYVFVLKED